MAETADDRRLRWRRAARPRSCPPPRMLGGLRADVCCTVYIRSRRQPQWSVVGQPSARRGALRTRAAPGEEGRGAPGARRGRRLHTWNEAWAGAPSAYVERGPRIRAPRARRSWTSQRSAPWPRRDGGAGGNRDAELDGGADGGAGAARGGAGRGARGARDAAEPRHRALHGVLDLPAVHLLRGLHAALHAPLLPPDRDRQGAAPRGFRPLVPSFRRTVVRSSGPARARARGATTARLEWRPSFRRPRRRRSSGTKSTQTRSSATR